MPITLKTRDGGHISCATHRLSRLSELPFYEDIVFIKVHEQGKQERTEHGATIELPDRLPKRLQILICSDCNLTRMPHLPESMLALYAKNNCLSELPPLAHLTSLEILTLARNSITDVNDFRFPQSLKNLDLSDNIITSFSVAQWPEHLVELDLSTNRLKEIDTSFDHLIMTCKVSLAYNDFPPQKHNAFTLWIDMQNAAHVASKIESVRRYIRFGIPIRVKASNEDMTMPSLATNSRQPVLLRRQQQQQHYLDMYQNRSLAATARIYTNSQNVHSSSVQQSADASVAWLIENARTTDPDITSTDAVTYLKRSWRPRRIYHICEWLRTWKANKILTKNFNDRTIHSVHGITYENLITLIWVVVRAHNDRNEILHVLKQEITASSGLCFTGRFTRTLNSLSGFIEHVGIRISDNEQMSHRIVQCLKLVEARYKKGTEAYEHEGRIQVAKILNDFHLTDSDRQAWLEAV